jgi:hypothetical protein
MDLKQFNSLFIDSTNEGRTFIELLINHSSGKEDKGKAIVEVYEAFNDQIKKDRKIFAPVFHQFFVSHKINNENFKYYEEFSKYWRDSEKEEIKKNNPHWSFSKSSFKDATEFTESFKHYSKGSFKKACDFLSNNEDEIKKLIKVDKTKLYRSMMQNNNWHYLFKNDYDIFSDFCSQYNYDKLETIKYLANSSNLKNYVTKSNIDVKSLNFILDNISNIFDEYSDYYTASTSNENNFNIVDTFLTLIIRNEHELAYKIFNKHQQELNDCLVSYIDSFGFNGYRSVAGTLDITNIYTWNQVTKILKQIHSHNEKYFYKEKFAIKPFDEVIVAIESIPKILECKEMSRSLENDLSRKDKDKQKLKI